MAFTQTVDEGSGAPQWWDDSSGEMAASAGPTAVPAGDDLAQLQAWLATNPTSREGMPNINPLDSKYSVTPAGQQVFQMQSRQNLLTPGSVEGWWGQGSPLAAEQERLAQGNANSLGTQIGEESKFYNSNQDSEGRGFASGLTRLLMSIAGAYAGGGGVVTEGAAGAAGGAAAAEGAGAAAGAGAENLGAGMLEEGFAGGVNPLTGASLGHTAAAAGTAPGAGMLEEGFSGGVDPLTGESLGHTGAIVPSGGGNELGGDTGLRSLTQAAAPVVNGSFNMNNPLQMLLNGSSPSAMLQQIASQYGGFGGVSGAAGLGTQGWGSPANLLSIGSGLYGLYESRKLKEMAKLMGPTSENTLAAANRADPWSASGGRALADTQLQGLMKDPSSITKMPGYEAGLQAVERKMASQGFNGSGNMMVALSKYGGDFYNQALQSLAAMSGANVNPGTAGQIMQQGTQQQLGATLSANDLASRSLASLGYGTIRAGAGY